jgi:hypothetical protein
MRGTRIEKEVEICATNLANKTKCMSTNAKKWKTFVKTYRDSSGQGITHVLYKPAAPLPWSVS